MNASPYFWGQPTTLQPNLRIHLLGSPIVFWNENVLSISRRLVRALLYRLACDPGPVGRGHLQNLFWAEVPESVARRNLSHQLTHLRRALPQSQVLVATGNEVWLEAQQVWCDIFEFRKAFQDPEPDDSLLHHLTNLYRGFFLDGFNLPGCPEFEHWCLLERNALEQQYLELLEYLIGRCTDRGEINQAIKYAQQYLKVDSLCEPIQQRLIQLYAGTGDRHLAIRQFERFSTILETELGVAPLPETKAVYRAIAHDQLKFPPLTSTSAPPKLPGTEAPIIGRKDELRRLEEIFSLLDAQQGRVVFISGEAGIGKSRLIREFANGHQDEARLLQSCGQAGEQVIPYQPILNILRTILGISEIGAGHNSPDISTKLDLPEFIEPLCLSEISRLLPEIQVIYPELPPPMPLEPESARTKLFDALCRLVLTYAITHGPVLLCLDDMQWLDATTKAWLIHIGRFINRGDCPIMILGTYRSEDAAAVLELRHTLARAGVLVELKLSGLGDSDLLTLQRHIIGQRAGDEMMASQLHQATGGNPFYLIEIIRNMIEEGSLERHLHESTLFNLPESVREAVQHRLQCLSPIARQVLEAGAVLGQTFSLELLRLTSGRNDIEIMSALQELEARILLVEAEQAYRFVHDITRQQVEQSLGDVRKQLLHRRAGRAFQHLTPNADPVLAFHFELGGDLQKALQYHRLAAQRAQMLFAWQVVEFHLGRMLALLNQLDPGCEMSVLIHQRGEALEERTRALNLQDRLTDRNADLEALSDLGEVCDDDSLRLQAIFNRLRYLIMDGDYPQAILAAEKGLALLESGAYLGDESDQLRLARSRLLAQIGFAHYFLGKPLEARGLLEEAWSQCEAILEPEACGRILHIMGYIYSHLANYNRSLECQQQAYAYHIKIDNYNLMAWDLIDIGAQYKNLGDQAQAESFLKEGLELSARVGSQRARAYGLTQLGDLERYRGDYGAAMVHYQQVLDMQQAAHYGYIIAAAEAGMGYTRYLLGDHVLSRHWLQRAVQRAQTFGLRKWAAEIMIQLGLVDIAEGDLCQARHHVESGLLLAQDCMSGAGLAPGLAAKARLERLSGNLTSALALAQEAVSITRQIGLTSCEMWGEIEAGLAYLAKGDPNSALEHTTGAARLAAHAGQDWIGLEEVHWAHACVLRGLNQDQVASLQELNARQVIQAKAEQISDAELRRCYLSRSNPNL
jgi:DNA-binding SARP family transcriptional activator